MDFNDEVRLEHGVFHLPEPAGHVAGEPVDRPHTRKVERFPEARCQLSPTTRCFYMIDTQVFSQISFKMVSDMALREIVPNFFLRED